MVDVFAKEVPLTGQEPEYQDPTNGPVAFDEKRVHQHPHQRSYSSTDEVSMNQVEQDLNVTENDLLQARDSSKALTLEETRATLVKIHAIHEHDPNFPIQLIYKIEDFLNNEDIFSYPEYYHDIINELKMEASLIINNSPYAEVRAVVDNTDDPRIPSSTIRCWVIGLLFVTGLAFVNQLFSIRQPNITLQANVAQLLAYPVGKAWAMWIPDWGVTFLGIRHSLNPGPFNRKEHMLITIMATVGSQTPYTDNIIWAQYLPTYFNQPYAGHFTYQILIALSTNFVGYGIAGLCRRFLVYPSYCLWPASLVTIALNTAFHSERNVPVLTPFMKKVMTISRLRFFSYVFLAMFVYFWLPSYLFQALTYFNWINWIAPNNIHLSAICGSVNGMGINPWPTFDWNVLLFDHTDPLMVPFFNTINKLAGTVVATLVAIGMWYTNTYSTGYLPINSNHVFDHFAQSYNISRAVDAKRLFAPKKYAEYSPAFLTSGNLTQYIFFFGIYAATISYAYLYHRHEIIMGFRNLYRSIIPNKNREEATKYEYSDIHNKLMKSYPEVPEWWYLLTLLAAIGVGCGGIAGWQTYTSVGVIFYGIALCLIFVVPIGIIKSITGMEVTLNVLAEFIGGSLVTGNALAMNYFKTFGYITCATAIQFTNDLKMAHYVKIAPKHTFWGQIIATFVSSVVCTGVLNFQMNRIPDVCQPSQANHYTCPGINTFFTAAVLWGTVGPPKLFGANGQYTATLVGFPIGFVVPIIVYYLQKKLPSKAWIRQVHPVVIFYGGLSLAPYNLTYVWPAVPISWFSMIYLKNRYLSFWSKYNYVVSAAFQCGIAFSAVIIFFALQWTNKNVNWWGNNVSFQGCENSNQPCPRLVLSQGEYFGPRIGDFH